MPDAFGRPTEEERMLAAYASNRMSPAMGSGMGNAMLSPEQLAEMSKSQEGKTLALKNQLAQANALRQTPAAQGKTVGPYDLYMGPNWGDVANSVGSQLVGGYMGAKAQQGLDKVDEQASATGLAKAKQAEALRIDEANKAAEALDYGRGRDTVSDKQWQTEYDFKVEKEKAAQKQAMLEEKNRLEIARLKEKGDSSKLFNKVRVVGEDGVPFRVGQDADGVMRREGTGEEVDMAQYQDALSEPQVAVATTKLTNDLRDIAPLMTSLQEYNEAVMPYSTEGDKPTPYGDIPGRGRFSGREGTVGYLGRALESATTGGKPEDMYAKGRAIANVKIREGAGLSQTAAEIERLRPVLEGEFGSDPQRMHDAILSIQRTLAQEMAQLKAGVQPQALRRYESSAGDNNLFNVTLPSLEFPTSPEEAAALKRSESGGGSGQMSRKRKEEDDPLGLFQ